MRSLKQFEQLQAIITHPIFAVIWFMLAAISFIFFDKPIAFYMHSISNIYFENTAQTLTFFGLGTYYIIFSAIIFLISKFIFKNNYIASIMLFLFLAVVVPGISCDLIKFILGRARPTELFHQGLYGFYFLQTQAAMWSFPSGHSTTIAGIMMACSLLWPRWWAICFGFALIIAMTRIIITAHYVSDVMVGLYLGSVMVIYLHRYLQQLPWMNLRRLKNMSQT